jgi:FkbM family methyltransferase
MHRLLGAASEPGLYQVRLSPLGGEPLWLRGGTTDARSVLDDLRFQAHVPSIRLRSDAAILDLGASVGATSAHLASLYPDSTIVAVEAHPDAARVCRANLRRFGDRCKVVEAAAWKEDGRVRFQISGDEEWAAAVTADGEYEADAISVETLTRDIPVIDFVKSDVEGAEWELFTEGAPWLDRVRSVAVEVHPRDRVSEFSDLLRGLGFDALEDRSGITVVGTRA